MFFSKAFIAYYFIKGTVHNIQKKIKCLNSSAIPDCLDTFCVHVIPDFPVFPCCCDNTTLWGYRLGQLGPMRRTEPCFPEFPCGCDNHMVG